MTSIFGRRNLEDLLEKLRRVLAHDDEAVGELCEFDHHAMLVGIRFAQHRMKGGHDRHAEFPQQLQDVAAGWPAENSVFVLHAYQIDIGEIEELGCTFDRTAAPLRSARIERAPDSCIRTPDHSPAVQISRSVPYSVETASHKSVVKVAIPHCRGR